MTTKLWLVLKKLALPLVVVYVIALTVASLMRLTDVPSFGSSFDDKIYHLVAYFMFTLLVFNYLSSKHIKKAILVSVVLTICYGIIIEVLQYALTTHRSFDGFDVIANSLGAMLAAITLRIVVKSKIKMN
ncbi:VanZ family protein [Psychroserpens sp.]|uniref:VanZ family protein n=1 Tax=Psychroserpens sp. TaxID=2020870 RepID=UPI003C77AFB4